MSLLLVGCGSKSQTGTENRLPPEETAVFTSTDQALQKTFEWAKKMALSYAHDGSDPVGLWYDAAVPKLEAFCMRNLAHQSVGAHILGLNDHNKNMFSRFAGSISDEKDWCGFWEINRYDNPCPADYLNDKEFWYNLNANFDLMQACLKMYLWTGDRDYIAADEFQHFFEKTTGEYVARWDLEPENIMHRTPYMNTNEEFDVDNNFHSCRGLPSYVENEKGFRASADLIASIYGGLQAYSRISALLGKTEASDSALTSAADYRTLLETAWWDKERSRYNSILHNDGSFGNGEGVQYILWFDTTSEPERIRAILEEIKELQWNVESLSHFPVLFYKYGYNEEGYDYLVTLPSMVRADYPEVSFGFIEGCVCGAMGFTPSFADNRIATLSHLADPATDSTIRNIPVFDGYMTLRHLGNHYSEIVNDTSSDIDWDASFIGDFDYVEAGGKRYQVEKSTDVKGNILTTARLPLGAYSSLSARAVAEMSEI